jgi:sorbitol-specific phosphotransferase system component IIA
VDIQDSSHKAMVEMYHENTLTLEKSRSQFHEMVIFIEKYTNVILENLKEMGMIKKDFDKHGKAVVKGKTTVVTDMVNYMNKLNDLVIQFYQEVYLIQKMDDMKDENGRVQGSLF